MRKFLIKFVGVVAFAATIAIVWTFYGRGLSLWVDRYRTVEVSSVAVKSLVYEGSGSGGTFRVDELALPLAPVNPKTAPPRIGTNKEGQLAISFGDKVFAFGPPRGETEPLSTEPQNGDEAAISIRHSILSWIEPMNFNFMTGKSPSAKRHLYQHLIWKKPNGAKLEMVWRYEQHHLREDGWTEATMTREGVTGLIRVEISDAAR